LRDAPQPDIPSRALTPRPLSREARERGSQSVLSSPLALASRERGAGGGEGLSGETQAVAFQPNGPADIELDWFFNLAEVAMGNRSNYAVLLGPQDGDTMEARAEACHARRLLRRRLLDLGSHDAGVLQVAYTARPWSLQLREELGRTTGVVVRLASAEEGLPDDDKELDVLERRTAARLSEALMRSGPAALDPYRAHALELFKRAFRAYERERGGKDKPALRAVL
jgi:hypothetical protein